MRLCSCGFANPDDAMRCAACGGALSHESAGDTLLLEDVQSGEVVRIPAPGGILGRAGDLSPDLFSPRVSGVHAVVAVDSEGRWTIEHAGRNASAVERGGVWSDLRCGAPQPLFGGEVLEAGRHGVPRAGGHPGGRGGRGRRGIGRAERSRRNCLVRANVPCAGPNMPWKAPKVRVAACTFCKDPLDALGRSRASRRGPCPAGRPPCSSTASTSPSPP